MYAYVINIISMLVMFIIIVNTMLWFVWHFHVSLFLLFMLMLMLYLLNVYVNISYLYHYYVNTCIVLYLYLFVCYLLTRLVYWINRKKKFYQSDLLSLYVFWYDWDNFRAYVFLSMHVVNFMFWVNMLWNWISHMARNYHFTISLKRGPMKILARSSIFSWS